MSGFLKNEPANVNISPSSLLSSCGISRSLFTFSSDRRLQSLARAEMHLSDGPTFCTTHVLKLIMTV